MYRKRSIKYSIKYIEAQERVIIVKCEKTISTGFQSLDEVLGGGFHAGNLNVIAARPGMCKRIFALQCAAGMVKNSGKRIPFFPMEMAADIIREKFAELRDRDSVILDDAAPITTSQIRAHLAGVSDLGAAVIGSFGLIQPEDGADEQNASKKANEIAWELKRIAREFDIPILCASRLPRSLREHRNRRHILKDLERISSVLVQDADVILSPYRHAYDAAEEIEYPAGAEIIVAKNRYGKCGSLPFRFDGRIPQFSEDI